MKTGVVLAACLLILVSGGGLGAWGAGRLKRRVELLAGAGAGVESLMRDLDHLALPLTVALEQAALCSGEAACLFAAASRHLLSGEGLTGSEAWSRALTETGWERDCGQVLACLGPGLGETDAPSQLQQLAACRQRLDRARIGAEQEYARFGKIWRAFGWCGGAVIILLLL